MMSKMGKATSSHFNALNPKKYKQTARKQFNLDRLLDPSLRVQKASKHEADYELIKMKQSFKPIEIKNPETKAQTTTTTPAAKKSLVSPSFSPRHRILR